MFQCTYIHTPIQVAFTALLPGALRCLTIPAFCPPSALQEVGSPSFHVKPSAAPFHWACLWLLPGGIQWSIFFGSLSSVILLSWYLSFCTLHSGFDGYISNFNRFDGLFWKNRNFSLKINHWEMLEPKIISKNIKTKSKVLFPLCNGFHCIDIDGQSETALLTSFEDFGRWFSAPMFLNDLSTEVPFSQNN